MTEDSTASVQRSEEIREEIETAIASGDLAYAANQCSDLGDLHLTRGDREGAESAYRQGVVLARQIDSAFPDLVLWAFRSLMYFLAPSEESIALGAELASLLIDRDDMYHPMRAAEAACAWAETELMFAEVRPNRMDHAIGGIAQPAIEMLDEACLHGQGQSLQRRVAAALRAVGRCADADQWQAESEKYEDWDIVMEQKIPGHVHLWDIRYRIQD